MKNLRAVIAVLEIALIAGSVWMIVRPDPQKEFTCPYEGCGQTFATQAELNAHIASVHGGSNYTCNVCGETFTSQQALDAHILSAHGNPSPAQNMILLESPVSAFTVEKSSVWMWKTWPSIVPSNAIIVLGLCRMLGGQNSDLYTSTRNDQNLASWDCYKTSDLMVFSVGTSSFTATYLAYFPVKNGGTYCHNDGGVAGPISVSVIGYVTAEASSTTGFFIDFAQQDDVLASGASAAWKTVDAATKAPVHSGWVLKGVYVAVECSSGTVNFRGQGSGGSHTWQFCPDKPGNHLLGWIPCVNGKFEYMSSQSVTIYGEGYMWQCPSSTGDHFHVQNNVQLPTHVTGSWTMAGGFTGKGLLVGHVQSPDQVGLMQVRPSGATNTQLSHYKESCGNYGIFCGLNGGAFQYCSTDTATNGETSTSHIFVGALTLHPHGL